MSDQAKGSFEITMKPAAEPVSAAGATLARMSLDKTYAGDLVATGKGEMLTAVTGVEGSASYVAIEHVEGTLGGRTGGFVLQHRGTMTRGEPDLEVRVVPDSGRGGLEGIAGSMAIDIVDGEHFYTLDYGLPA